MPFDKMAPSYVLEQEMHRRKYYPYIFYCPACQRSYISKTQEETCKFCEGPVKPTTGGKKFVQFCKSCDIRIESDEQIKFCKICGNHLATIYKWEALGKKEKEGVRIARFVHHFKKFKRKVEQAKKIQKINKKGSKKKPEKTVQQRERYKGEELTTEELRERKWKRKYSSQAQQGS